MTADERQRLDEYIEQGFRGLQLDDIKHSDAADVRMGTFQQCAAFLDALALTYSAGLPVKAGMHGKYATIWDRFVRRFFTGDTRAALVGRYGDFRCLLLHNFSASGFAFTHDHPHLHLKRHGTLIVLDRESFVEEVVRAFDGFCEEIAKDDGLASRALTHLNKKPPMAVWVLDDRSADTASTAVSLGSSPSAVALTGTGRAGGVRASAGPVVRTPRLATSIKKKPPSTP